MSETVTISTGYTPRWFVKPFHGTVKRFACIVAHRRAGKTVACINDLIRHTLQCPKPNARGAYVAPTYQQAKDVAWMYLVEYTRKIPGVRYHESELRVDFPNGSRVRLYGAENYDRLRGLYFDYVVIDEVADMKPEAWNEVIRPTLSDRQGRATFIGTPKGRNLFYDIYRLAEKSDDWYSVKLPVTETDALTEAEVEDARLTMPPNAFLREYMCDFSVEAENQFISLNDCMESVSRETSPTGPVVMGVDVARFGDDRTVFLVRNGGTIPVIETASGLDLMQTAAKAYSIAMHNDVQRIFVDGAGVGGGVVDRLRHLGLNNVVDVNSGRRAKDEAAFVNLRAETWTAMADHLRLGLQIPNNQELIDDLTAPLYEYDFKNRIKMEPKDNLRKRGLPSPDLADALALTYAEPVSPRDAGAFRSMANVAQQGVADPFNDPIFDNDPNRRNDPFVEWL